MARFAVGGLDETREANVAIQQICDDVQPQVVKELGKSFEVFVAIKYCTQVVAGINFFVKVRVSDDDFIHVRIYKDLEQKVSLSGCQTKKKYVDPIIYFEGYQK